MSILKVSRLNAGYGQIGILYEVGLEVAKAEVLGVLGHNGMGKSTLLKALAGILPVTAGAIAFADVAITAEPAHARARRGVGYVPQGRQIFSGLTVRENLAFAAVASKTPLAIVEETFARIPRLRPIADRPGGVLSGGEQQILALARCLCAKPALILLDEPTEGVQPSIRDEIVELLLRLRNELGISMLLVEQNVKFMNDLADRVLRMEKGRIAARAFYETAA